MIRDYELDALKAKEREIYQRKQELFERYQEARDLTNEAYAEMQSAWDERSAARDAMNREYEELQEYDERCRAIWDEYGAIRDHNSSQIDALRSEADQEHQAMVDSFERANAAYDSGERAEAKELSIAGHEHKSKRDNLNAEVSKLVYEIKNAKQAAKWRAPRADNSAFHAARTKFEAAKAHHELAQAKFKRLKDERNRLKGEFDSAQAEFLQARDASQMRLEELRAKKQLERERTLDKAGIRYSERENAKIVRKADGTIQIYSGGLGSGDGFGHGHVALDSAGRKIYERGAFEAHGEHNYTDSPIRTRIDYRRCVSF